MLQEKGSVLCRFAPNARSNHNSSALVIHLLRTRCDYFGFELGAIEEVIYSSLESICVDENARFLQFRRLGVIYPAKSIHGFAKVSI